MGSSAGHQLRTAETSLRGCHCKPPVASQAKQESSSFPPVVQIGFLLVFKAAEKPHTVMLATRPRVQGKQRGSIPPLCPREMPHASLPGRPREDNAPWPCSTTWPRALSLNSSPGRGPGAGLGGRQSSPLPHDAAARKQLSAQPCYNLVLLIYPLNRKSNSQHSFFANFFLCQASPKGCFS